MNGLFVVLCLLACNYSPHVVTLMFVLLVFVIDVVGVVVLATLFRFPLEVGKSVEEIREINMMKKDSAITSDSVRQDSRIEFVNKPMTQALNKQQSLL